MSNTRKNNNLPELRKINEQFYELIKNLQKKGFPISARETTRSYECFMAELSERLSDKL